jgi:hypothetical protein
MTRVSVDAAARFLWTGLNQFTVAIWRFSFCRDCLQPLQREIFSSTTQLSAHDRVLAMDEKIRTYRLPEVLQSDIPRSDRHHAHLGMILSHRAFLTTLIHGSASMITYGSIDPDIVYLALLRLHRAHLLSAIQQHPENASKSPFAVSLGLCYRSASAILAMWSTSYEAIVS